MSNDLVSQGHDDVPQGYSDLLADLKARVGAAQVRAHRIVNTELLALYWSIGTAVLERQSAEGWGARVIHRLADDLRAEFPEMRGFSGRNLHYMTAAVRAWPDPFSQVSAQEVPRRPIVQQAVAQLPWGHVTTLLDRLDDQGDRDWYAAAAVEHGWSRAVLLNQIKNRLRSRAGVAPSNFEARLARGDSELAQQLTRDPYVFDFLDLTASSSERELEQGLMDRLQHTLSEFGRGFSFVGRQVHFDVEGHDFFIDLLFFHVEQMRYVVVELKVVRFEPGFAGQLGFYVTLVDDRLRRPDRHAPTVGILLCAAREDAVVQYALTSAAQPIAVADYTYAMPTPGALPSAAELAKVVDAALASNADPTIPEGGEGDGMP